MPTESCRYGHCTRLRRFCPTCVGEQFDLCGRSKASASFLLVAAALTAVAVYRVVTAGVRSQPVSAAALLPLHVLAALASLIAWTVWARWNQLVNDDAAGRAGTTAIGPLSLTGGFALCVVGFVCSALAAFACFLARRAENAAGRGGPAKQKYEARPNHYDTTNTPVPVLELTTVGTSES
jgi:hypothetical protein